MGARHQEGIGLSYRPARLHRLAEFIPWYQFRGPINIQKYGLWLQSTTLNGPNHRLNIEVDLQSLFGLHVTRCAQLFSLAETPQLTPPSAFGLLLPRRLYRMEGNTGDFTEIS
jgi:hypothetical protein